MDLKDKICTEAGECFLLTKSHLDKTSNVPLDSKEAKTQYHHRHLSSPIRSTLSSFGKPSPFMYLISERQAVTDRIWWMFIYIDRVSKPLSEPNINCFLY